MFCFFQKKNQDFNSLIAKFINDVTDLGEKHTQNDLFSIKNVIVDWIFFLTFYHSFGHVKD